MLVSAIKINLFLMRYCGLLVGDVADERMADQPVPGVNHPAWVLGHLAYSADGGVALAGGEKSLPAEWTSHYGPGSKVSPARGDYPPRDDLLAAAEQGFERLRGVAAAAGADRLAQPNANPRMKDALPTAGDVVAFLLTGHLGVHLGQLSAWRRMTGRPP